MTSANREPMPAGTPQTEMSPGRDVNIKDLDMQAKIFFDDEDESKSSGDKHEGPGQVL